MTRTIIHVDLDAFFCAIEEQRDPTLRGKAFAVGGQPDQRGVVASCSYQARRFGVRSAMSMARALTLCPRLIIVPSRHSEYRAASQKVMARLRALTPLVEQISIDEAFLDISALVSPTLQGWTGPEIARRLQKRIERELGLSCSVGIATNKMVAKIATDYGKASSTTGQSPQAMCVVPAGAEARFLAPLPANALWGVGPKTAEQLTAQGIHTIGDLAKRPQQDLIRRFGRHGYDLSLHAQGIDKREIVTERETKSISSETTFVRDVEDWDILHETVQELTSDVVRRLRRHKLLGTTIKIKLRWKDFTTLTRQTTLLHPTCDENLILETATDLLKQWWLPDQPVRLMGVGISGLSPLLQLSLWDAPIIEEPVPAAVQSATEVAVVPEKQQQLRKTLADLQQRFGSNIVQLGFDVEDYG